MGAPRVSQPFPFFKETESNKDCCQCAQNRNVYANENPQVVANNPADFNTMPTTSYVANGSHFVKVEKSSSVETLRNPVPLGPALLRKEHAPQQGDAFEKARVRINLDRVHKDRTS